MAIIPKTSLFSTSSYARVTTGSWRQREVEQTNGEKKAQEIQNFAIRYTHVYRNAHQDDIHALIRMPNNRFVSGSKDGTMHQWTWNGDYVKTVQDSEKIDYNKWITAVALVDDECWVSGTRNGEVDLWSVDGEWIAQLPVGLPEEGHKSKERNLQRINCLSKSNNSTERTCFVGFPTQFAEYSLEREKELSLTPTSANDWVYCLHSLSETRLLVVTGCILNIWKKQGDQWRTEVNLVEEPKSRQKQRPFISSLTPLESDPHRFGIAVFDGSVRVVNIETRKTETQWSEHVNRVWTIENLTRNVFASCGDDRCIKLWDVRANKSVKTISRHIGRVSTLLRLNDHFLVAGTCPDNLKNSQEAAQLVYYDFRN